MKDDDKQDKEEINTGRRRFLVAASTVVGGIGVASAAVPFASSMLPSAKAQAAGAPIEVDLTNLQPGQMTVVEWRGKPVWIIHRTQEDLERLAKVNDDLRDPDSRVDQQPAYAKNYYRSVKPDYLVLVGVCTHLGCSPTFRPEPGSIDSNWQGGFYCPCHGSKYDMAGRIYKGMPAPLNLQVPPYHFISQKVIVIGEGPEKV